MRVVTIGYNWWIVVKIGGFVFSMAPFFNASYIATPVGLASCWPMLADVGRLPKATSAAPGACEYKALTKKI